MSRLFQDTSKAEINGQVFTGDPQFLSSSNSGTNVATAAQTKAIIEQTYSYYTSPINYQTVATIGALGTSIIFDASGNLYWAIASYYNGTTYNLTSYVYKITPSGTLTTFASVATNGAFGTDLKFDIYGNLYWAIGNYSNGSTNITSYVYKITSSGTLTTFASVATNGAYGTSLLFDTSGNLYWAISNNYNGTTYNLTSYVYKITTSGSLTTFASQSTNGANATDLIFDTSGNLYWAIGNYFNGTTYNLTSYVYKITSAGVLTTFASQATTGAYGTDLIFDASGNLYWAIASYYNGAYNLTSYVYKITSAGVLTTFASRQTVGAYTRPSLIFDSFGNLYWAICNHYNGTAYSQIRNIYKITPDGTTIPFASIPSIGGYGSDIQFDTNNNLYWAMGNFYNGTTYSLNSYIYRFNKQVIN